MRPGMRLTALCVTAILATPSAQQPAEVEPKAVFTGVVVKLTAPRTESAEPPAKVANRLKTRLPGGRAAWAEAQVEADGSMYEFRPIAHESTGEPGTPLTSAQAWEAAHAIRSDARVEYAEPAFRVSGAPGETVELEDCRPAAGRSPESGTDSPPLPGAVADSEWSLGASGANVLEAWKLLPPDRTPGDGVWIGHPDTGYRTHPEIWQQNGPVRADLGWDFVDNDGDPLDGFASGTLNNPGHGTRTSSVIVSPRGRQLSGDSTRAVSGVAPGARLIPLRVANGVVLFDQSNLAEAIRAAAGDDRTRVKQKVDVISISLGGPPSRALKDAVSLAERRGVLVLAAAGNQVRTVVWPARYDNVIAIAASNADSKPWSGSSAGKAVAIAAPGESVWVASPRHVDPAPLDCLQMGSGTSYGVATTAGIAALWVSRHRSDPAFQALRASGRQTEAFRRILTASFRTVPDWRTGSYGPGIVDAVKVLSAPLPRITESAAAPTDRCSRDLEALESVFDEAPNPRARLRQLFGTDPCRAATVADETAFLYATDDTVRDAFDAIAGAGEPARADYQRARDALRRQASRPLRAQLPSR
jgi:hypothetical protein